MNSDKSEVMWFSSCATLARLAARDRSLQIGSEIITPATTSRLLGVLLDAELTMKPHIARTASTCFYHLRRIRQIRRRVGADIAERLVLALVTSRLDYCNSSLAGLPQSSLDPLQRVQNAAARLILELRPRDHVTPSLIQLHWLPVRFRVQYKLCTLMHHIHIGRAPTYLINSVQATSTSPTRSGLRSASTTNYVTPRLRTKFGERAFSFAGPAAWNALPTDLRALTSSSTFRRRLKTHLFLLAFDLS
jgi:hypothetical protein